MLERAVQEVEVFKGLSTLATSTTNESGHTNYLDVFKCWIAKTHDLHMLVPLVWGVLVNYVSQTQSERLFSSSGEITTKSETRLARIT